MWSLAAVARRSFEWDDPRRPVQRHRHQKHENIVKAQVMRLHTWRPHTLEQRYPHLATKKIWSLAAVPRRSFGRDDEARSTPSTPETCQRFESYRHSQHFNISNIWGLSVSGLALWVLDAAPLPQHVWSLAAVARRSRVRGTMRRRSLPSQGWSHCTPR